VAHILRLRSAAEGRPDTSAPEQAARELMSDIRLGPSGPTELGKALDLAHPLFTATETKPPAEGSPEEKGMHERVSDITHHLLQGARALMSDEEYDPYCREWVRMLFDPKSLLD
jgi:hypothetical protein